MSHPDQFLERPHTKNNQYVPTTTDLNSNTTLSSTASHSDPLPKLIEDSDEAAAEEKRHLQRKIDQENDKESEFSVEKNVNDLEKSEDNDQVDAPEYMAVVDAIAPQTDDPTLPAYTYKLFRLYFVY